MDRFWTWAGSLQGQTVQTVTGKPFDIVAASCNDWFSIVSRSSGIARTVGAAEFERALALGLRGRDLIPRRIRDAGASEFNPAYVCAILRQPELSVCSGVVRATLVVCRVPPR
jgi:hypothetical protein